MGREHLLHWDPPTASASPSARRPLPRLPGPRGDQQGQGPWSRDDRNPGGPGAGAPGASGPAGVDASSLLVSQWLSGGSERKCRHLTPSVPTQLRGSVWEGLFAGCLLPGVAGADCLPRVSWESPPSGAHLMLAFHAEIPERQGTECPTAPARCPRAPPRRRHLLPAAPSARPA